MRVRMLTSIAGADFALSPGDEHEFTAAEAQRMIEAGYAEAVGQPVVERTVRKPAPARRTRG